MTSDLSEFLDVFFEECFEGLDAMESGLVSLDSDSADSDTINAIFRAAHSIKGGAAAFDMMDVSNFTHVMEALLDQMRDGRREVSVPAVDLLLKSVDGLRSMLVAQRAGDAVDMQGMASLKDELEAMLAGDASSPGAAPEPPPVEAQADDAGAREDVANRATPNHWDIAFAPHRKLFATGNDPKHVFRALEELGELTVRPDVGGLPEFSEMDPEACYLSWRLTLITAAAEHDIREAFAWVESDSELEISRADANVGDIGDPPATGAADVEPSGPTPKPAAPDAPESTRSPVADRDSAPAAVTQRVTSSPAREPTIRSPQAAAGGEAASIRVSIEKVDELINLVGELVITQSMLNRFADGVGPDEVEQLRDGLGALARNTRELQETAMQIRMLPISTSFNRFPRLIRDLSAKLDKKVELKISGGNTELDKTVLEKIGDPLVHLVRNSLDHGIEDPHVRREAGKSETGVVHLNAYHQGGSIIIEVMDDGAGLDTDKILAKARERGVIDDDAELTEEQINNLIFQAGFSTAEVVTDVSGRGVGMDVVRRNILELGGSVTVDSVHGRGSIFTVRLPLTLAILDGQLVRVGDQVYIISLVSIVESLQVRRELVNVVAGRSEIYKLRDEFIPIIRLHRTFNVPSDSTELEQGLLVVVEANNGRVGLFVDDLLGQQQVVIKSLESNFRQVEGLSGATILGDGRVALILDVPGLVNKELANRRSGTLRLQAA